jgi:hypothetical protein
VALTKEGQLYSWGDNLNGELGNGNFKSLTQPSLMTEIEDKKVCAVACGTKFAIALGQNIKSNTPLGESVDYMREKNNSAFSKSGNKRRNSKSNSRERVTP